MGAMPSCNRTFPTAASTSSLRLVTESAASADRCVERDGERRLAAHQVLPAQLLALAPPLQRELQPFRRDRQRVRLVLDGDLAPESSFQLGHGFTLHQR